MVADSNAHLSVAIGPKVHAGAYEIVQSGVGALIHQDTGCGEKREEDDSELD